MKNCKIITIWDRVNPELMRFGEVKVEFNHISDGYDPEALEPTPASEHQRQHWRGQYWQPRLGYLTSDNVVIDSRIEGRPE